MDNAIDVRGLSCPEPVIEVKKALSQATSGEFTVLVSSPVARDNVKRTATGMGWKVEVAPEGEDFKLTITS